MPVTLHTTMPSVAYTPPPAPPMGKVTVTALGTANVSVPAITANSLVFLSVLSGSGTLNLSSGVTITPGVGFSVTSAALSSTTIAWEVLEP